MALHPPSPSSLSLDTSNVSLCGLRAQCVKGNSTWFAFLLDVLCVPPPTPPWAQPPYAASGPKLAAPHRLSSPCPDSYFPNALDLWPFKTTCRSPSTLCFFMPFSCQSLHLECSPSSTWREAQMSLFPLPLGRVPTKALGKIGVH